MKTERFNELMKNLKIPSNEWVLFDEIEAIVLNTGIGIYPNWVHQRFMYNKDGYIFLKCGDSEPYGGRLSSIFSLGIGGQTITFQKNNVLAQTGFPLFRLPEPHDVLNVTQGRYVSLVESIILNVINSENNFSMDLSNPIYLEPRCILSFYDPNQHLRESVHGTISEGVYMNFIENPPYITRNSKVGQYHKTIKVSDIAYINLKLNKEYQILKYE